MTKTCVKCGCDKQPSEFTRCKSTVDKLQPSCKSCVSEYNKVWRANNKEKKSADDKAWRTANAAKVKATLKAYYLKNKSEVTAQNKKWSDANPDKVHKAKMDWAERNRDYIREKSREYARKNPDKAKINVQNRRARRLASNTKLSYGITTLVLNEQGNKCPGCLCDLRTTKKHIDHFMPLILGGLHVDSNIQILCAACNLRKSQKHPLKWLSEIQNPQISETTS